MNLSQRHIHQEEFVRDIQQIVQRSGVQPDRIELEITESLMMEDSHATADKLQQLKRLGFRISVDDFGTGYSSLSYLKDLPIDTLKIDRSFIQSISENEAANPIISMIVSMAKHLKLQVVAEGVETQEQLSYLKGLECQEVQGFYFSRPLPAEEIQGYLKQQV